MSVSIAKMVEQAETFQAKQLAEFKTFVDTSKQLKGALETDQNQAQENWETLTGWVKELAQPVPASGEVPIQALASDARYEDALKSERFLPPGFNQPKESMAYIDEYQKQVDEYLKEQVPKDE